MRVGGCGWIRTSDKLRTTRKNSQVQGYFDLPNNYRFFLQSSNEVWRLVIELNFSVTDRRTNMVKQYVSKRGTIFFMYILTCWVFTWKPVQNYEYSKTKRTEIEFANLSTWVLENTYISWYLLIAKQSKMNLNLI